MEKKVMSDYSCYCTPEQTKKALELGAPIERDGYEDRPYVYIDGAYLIPTAEQMLGWLEEQKSITIEVSRQYGINKYCYYIFDNYGNDIESIESKIRFSSRKKSVLAAIDAALEYLMDNKK